ncbi:hypothetical protein [Thiothrix subterranea]|uniref:Uncharacterized protein n=1 Tax=Thiothrix subterranea TaxID=2735563 RepID=A0AA51R5C7_9GAMM|nr:hypothetical protein [Thiothrix subterranea]MDQ5768499.1 hypothetical protein [Thiothrix subterranea]WML87620.1 hypothetical protein RCG00_04470 [Thiothrix subterranea]
MNTEIEIRKKIEWHLVKIADLRRHLAYIDGLLATSKWLTFLLFLAFTLSLYLGDILHLQTLITSFMGSAPGFSFYLIICLMLAYVLAGIKHAAYSHMAMFGRVLAIVAVVVSMGLLAEVFQSSGNQDTKARVVMENSAEFKAAVNANPLAGLNLSSNTGNLTHLQGELAEAQSYLQSCKKTCHIQQAKVDKLNAQIAAEQAVNADHASNLATLTQTAVQAQTERIRHIEEKGYNPTIRSIASITGLQIATAIVLVMLFISAQFETLHYWLSEMKARALMALDGLQTALVRLEVEYFQATGLEFDGSAHADLEPITRPAPRSRQEHKTDFGFIPQTASMAHSSVTPALFKWQQQPAHDKPRNGLGFIGFVDPDKPKALHGHVLHGHVVPEPIAETIVLTSPNTREGQEDKEGICPQCGARFRKVNKQHRFCCSTCRDSWHNQQQPQRLRYQGIRKQRQ